MSDRSNSKNSEWEISCPFCKKKLFITEMPWSFPCIYCGKKVSVDVTEKGEYVYTVDFKSMKITNTLDKDEESLKRMTEDIIDQLELCWSKERILKDLIKKGWDNDEATEYISKVMVEWSTFKKTPEGQETVVKRNKYLSYLSFFYFGFTVLLLVFAFFGPWLHFLGFNESIFGAFKYGFGAVSRIPIVNKIFGLDSSIPIINLVVLLLFAVFYPLAEVYKYTPNRHIFFGIRIVLTLSLDAIWIAWFFQMRDKLGHGIRLGWGFFVSAAILGVLSVSLFEKRSKMK